MRRRAVWKSRSLIPGGGLGIGRRSIGRCNHPGKQRAVTESGATRQINEVEISRRTQGAGAVHRQGGGASGPIASGRRQLTPPGGQNWRSSDDVTAMIARADLVSYAVHESHPVVAGQQLETEEMRSARQTGDGSRAVLPLRLDLVHPQATEIDADGSRGRSTCGGFGSECCTFGRRVVEQNPEELYGSSRLPSRDASSEVRAQRASTPGRAVEPTAIIDVTMASRMNCRRVGIYNSSRVAARVRARSIASASHGVRCEVFSRSCPS